MILEILTSFTSKVLRTGLEKGEFNFLPMLPDVIGRQFRPELLRLEIADLSKRFNFKFIVEEALSVDSEKRIVKGKRNQFLR